jgi:Ca2+/H+ antiporter, TMEM165/GDT1 family
MFESILIPFGTIFVAELLDKSQLSILLLSSKTKSYLQLILGIFFAFLLVDGLAIFLGSYLTTIVPVLWIKILSGVLFITFGIMSLLKKDEDKPKIGKVRNTFIASFSLIFLSEWGDKTQLASALFATKYDPLLVFLGVMLALMLLAIGTILLSRIISANVRPGVISKVAGLVFILIGISFFITN